MAVYTRYIQARIKGRLHGSETISVFHFGSNEVAPNNDALVQVLIALATAIIQCAIAQLLGAASSDWTLEEVDCQQLSPALSDPVGVAAPAGSVGLRQPVNVSFESILMRKRSGFGGKRKRGRNFLPPPGDADLVNSVLIAGAANDFYSGFINCLKGKFVGPTATEPFRMLILSQKTLKDNPGNFDLATVEVSSLEIEQVVSSMRSRKLGVGS